MKSYLGSVASYDQVLFQTDDLNLSYFKKFGKKPLRTIDQIKGQCIFNVPLDEVVCISLTRRPGL